MASGAGQGVLEGEHLWRGGEVWQLWRGGEAGIWQVLAGSGRFWQVLAGSGRFWQVPAGSGRFWQVLAGSGIWASGTGRVLASGHLGRGVLASWASG